MIERIRIFNKEGRVTFSTDADAPDWVDKTAEACFLCHAEEEPLPEGRQAVGCEVCHGPGGEHVRAPKRSPLRRRPTAEVCLRCHTPAQDDGFDFKRDLKRAAHPE